MIGKAKIFLYALFSPNKHVPPAKFKVKWYHKCVLVLVRRCKNFKDCPKELSYYDWILAKKHSDVPWRRFKTCLVLMGILLAAKYTRERDDEKRKKDLEARKAAGLPPVEKYELGLSTDGFYHTYNTEFPDNYKYP